MTVAIAAGSQLHLLSSPIVINDPVAHSVNRLFRQYSRVIIIKGHFDLKK